MIKTNQQHNKDHNKDIIQHPLNIGASDSLFLRSWDQAIKFYHQRSQLLLIRRIPLLTM